MAHRKLSTCWERQLKRFELTCCAHKRKSSSSARVVCAESTTNTNTQRHELLASERTNTRGALHEPRTRTWVLDRGQQFVAWSARQRTSRKPIRSRWSNGYRFNSYYFSFLSVSLSVRQFFKQRSVAERDGDGNGRNFTRRKKVKKKIKSEKGVETKWSCSEFQLCEVK